MGQQAELCELARLLAVPAGQVDDFFAAGAEHGQPAWVVGEVIEGEGIEVVA